MAKGMLGLETIKVLVLCLILLLLGLTITSRIVLPWRTSMEDKRCTGDIAAMGKLPTLTGEGIRCPTRERRFTAEATPQAALARELAACAVRFGLFQQDPFHGSAATNICIVCSTIEGIGEVRDVDAALLTESHRGKSAYTILTGKNPSANLRAVLQRVPDDFTESTYAVVWLQSNRATIAELLADWGMLRRGELWHGDLLELIPGESVDAIAGSGTIIGAGRGIFAPDREGLSQAVLLLSAAQARENGCVVLGDAPYKPPV